MKQLTVVNYKYFLVVLTFLFFISCNTKHDIPFPEKETEFEQPTTRPLHLNTPVKINWIVNKEDSIPPPREQPFDIDKIPAKPFYVNGFKPFSKPPAEEKLDWNNLPSTPFDIDTVAAKPLVYKTIRINAPVRIKAGIPKTKTPVSKNIVQLGEEEVCPWARYSKFARIKRRLLDCYGQGIVPLRR